MAREDDRLPYFPFFPGDFLSSSKVARMTLQEQGAFVRLLCYQWQDGPLPEDPDRLAPLCNVPPETMKELWKSLEPAFEKRDGGLVNPRLDRERRRVENRREKLSEAGKRGARKRWSRREENGETNGNPNGEAMAGPKGGHGQAMASTESDTDTQKQQQKQKEDVEKKSGSSSEKGGADLQGDLDLEDAIGRVWSHYLERYADRYSESRADRLKLTAAGRDGHLRERLREGYSPAELCRAIDGCFDDEWHAERQKDDLEYILRNQSKVEDFLNRAERNGGRPESRPDGREELAAMREAASDD